MTALAPKGPLLKSICFNPPSPHLDRKYVFKGAAAACRISVKGTVATKIKTRKKWQRINTCNRVGEAGRPIERNHPIGYCQLNLEAVMLNRVASDKKPDKRTVERIMRGNRALPVLFLDLILFTIKWRVARSIKTPSISLKKESI